MCMARMVITTIEVLQGSPPPDECWRRVLHVGLLRELYP